MLTGTCLCGAVTIEVTRALEHAPEACHCTQCRKQSGHFLAAVNVKREFLRITGEEAVTWYRSSEQVERGFCSICGSTLFWRPLIDGYEYTGVAMGVWDQAIGSKLAKHTFVGDRGDYYEIDDGAVQSDAY